MHYLTNSEEQQAQSYLDQAASLATLSCCLRSRCGCIIIRDNQVIGRGFNSPPQNIHLEQCLKDTLPEEFKSDKTCCLHAEQRAIIDALANHPAKLPGSRLYFIRIDQNNHKLYAGQPYCTICSKMALDTNIAEFVLCHQEGICVYDTKEYNDLSFQFRT